MNIAIFLSMISLIPLLFSINFLFLSNTYANLTQDSTINIHLASTNHTFTESESRIPPSVPDEE